MVTKFLKLFILVGVLGIHTGCFQMSNDSGDAGGAASSSPSAPNQRGFGGTLNLTPTKTLDVKNYLTNYDFSSLEIKSSSGSGGNYYYSIASLRQRKVLEFHIKREDSYVVTLRKGNDVVLQERLK